MSAMEEWQRRQRVEKEAERKKKTESAEMLRGYRGGVKDEDLKLKALREEERKKQLAAQQNLHSYKAKDMDEELKLKNMKEEERKKYLAAQQNLHNYKAKDLPVGSRTSLGNKEPRYSNTPQAHPPVSAGVKSGPADPNEGIVSGSVSSKAAAIMDITTPRSTTAEKVDGAAVAAAPGVIPAPDIISTAAEAAVPTTGITEPPSGIGINEPALAEERPAVDVQPVAGAGATVATEPETRATQGTESATNNDTTTEEPVRLDVLFSFGIISMQAEPDLSSYMTAVQTVVGKTLEGHTDIQFDPNQGPFVKSTELDASFVSRSGRTDVRRIVVTAAVPVTIPTIKMRSKAKQTVVGALQNSIQSGEFLTMSQGL